MAEDRKSFKIKDIYNAKQIVNNWKKNIDIVETQIIEYKNEIPNILKSFNYYIGLAENAISYFEMIKEEILDEKLMLSHDTIQNNTIKYIYDPTFLIFEHVSKDIATYLKNKHFNYENCLNELEDMIIEKNINRRECIILIGYMLYPDYYFKELERTIYQKKETEYIKNIINGTKRYEKMLNELFYIINKYFEIPKVSWINI